MAGSAPSDHAVLGAVVGVFGVRGRVVVRSFTRPADNLLSYPRWWLDQREYRLVDGGWNGSKLTALLAGAGGGRIADRDQAEALIGCEISVPADELPAAEDNEVYWRDLMGCDVVTASEQPLGTITDMMETGANDVMVVTGERERLIPFVWAEVVTDCDVAARRVVVDWDPDFE